MDDSVVVSNAAITKYGIIEAVLLAFLIKQSNEQSNNEWWFSIKAETVINTLNLSRRTFESALGKLVSSGIISTKLSGLPARKWFRLNLQIIESEFVQNVQTSLQDCNKQDCLQTSLLDCTNRTNIIDINTNTDSSTENNINNNSSSSTTSNTSITTEKEEKKIYKRKDEKKLDLSFVGIAYADAFNMWLEYKRQTHDAYKTQRGVELCYRKLLEYSNNNPNTFAKIIEQSIANNWKGLYELKDNNQNNKRYGRNGFNDPEETMRLIIEGAKAGYAERSAAKGTL